MESDRLDKQIRERIKDSEMYYAPQATQAYSRIWEAVDKKGLQEKSGPKRELLLYKCISAAAVFLLLLVSAVLFIFMRQSNAEVIALKQEVEQLYLLAKEKEIKDMLIQSQEVENNALKNSLAALEKKVVRDTIYITQVKEVARPKEIAENIAPPLIPEQAERVLPEALKLPEDRYEVPETSKLHFVLAENQVEPQKMENKSPGLRFRLGNGRGNMHAPKSQGRLLSVHASF